MSDKINLNNNKTDILTSVAKSAVGAVPFAGALLSELVGNVIPDQRFDRLTKYIEELDKKISDISEEKINNLKDNDEFIDLIEEGFVQASRAITDERRRYISSIVTNGITNDSIKLQESKFLLKLLQELNDIEIIWLRFYLFPTFGGDEEFRNKHENILDRIQPYLGADKEIIQKAALQYSYIQHLERLGLIKNNIRFDKDLGQPLFNQFTGQPEISYSEITQLGKLLLEQISLI
ncbi:MAG: hypothetical protein SVY15_00440 [Halobacteriota archaeon]|nr:hypothetical protein [Halobacteriota archaeon]